jgi:deferrochelatase/peroxidase EfeB
MEITTTGPVVLPDYSDIQGLIVHGYTHPYSVHMLFEFTSTDLSAVPGFFQALLPFLRSAEDWGALKPQKMLNIGLTWNGLQLLKPQLNGSLFPWAYNQGPENSQSQISLFDVGLSAPEKWWNQKFKTANVHCIVHAYAMTPEAQDEIVATIAAAAAAAAVSVTELKPMKTASGRIEQYPLIPPDFIHFNYRDSIDEPNLAEVPSSTDQQDLGQFLIGYTTVPGALLPSPTGTSQEALFAKNGCYNAFRILYQDVAAFESYLKTQAVTVAPLINRSEEETIEWLAAKLNGRWRNGSPLVLSPDQPDKETSKATDFGYETDTQGLKCPFSAHTRVSNPRNESIFAPEAPVPRLIRRGMPYGPPLTKDTATEDRGLIGLFLCGDFSTQFEKIYGWINANNFSGLFKKGVPQDPLVGNRPAGYNPSGVNTSFTIPMDGKPAIVLPALPQFVVTRGTAYCLLPSISSIKNIAGVS